MSAAGFGPGVGTPFAATAGLVRVIAEQGSTARIRPDQGVVFIRDWPNSEKRLAGAAVVMTQLAAGGEGGVQKTRPFGRARLDC